MDALIQAVENLGQRDWVEIALAGSSFIVSIVAIWISLRIAHKQNKIALFNLRYEALHSLALLKAFIASIATVENVQDARTNFKINFCANVDFNGDKITALQQVYVEIRKIEKSISITNLVFPEAVNEPIQQILVMLSDYLNNLVYDKIDTEKRDALCLYFQAFWDIYHLSLVKKTCLTQKKPIIFFSRSKNKS